MRVPRARFNVRPAAQVGTGSPLSRLVATPMSRTAPSARPQAVPNVQRSRAERAWLLSEGAATEFAVLDRQHVESNTRDHAGEFGGTFSQSEDESVARQMPEREAAKGARGTSASEG